MRTIPAMIDHIQTNPRSSQDQQFLTRWAIVHTEGIGIEVMPKKIQELEAGFMSKPTKGSHKK